MDGGIGIGDNNDVDDVDDNIDGDENEKNDDDDEDEVDHFLDPHTVQSSQKWEQLLHNNNNYYYYNYNLNYKSSQQESSTNQLIQRLRRRLCIAIQQCPMLLQIVALLIWIHNRFWQFYYETLTRRLQ